MTITEFLLARIADDEVAAKGVRGGLWNGRVALLPPDLYGLVSRHHPARVLAECEAKRRLVVMHSAQLSGSRYTLRILALPYADHPDYDEAWRP